MSTPRPPSTKPLDADAITRAFDQLESDEKLIDEVLAMSPEAIAAELGPERVARAERRAEETRKHYEALAAKLGEETTSTSASTSTSTSSSDASGPSLRVEASSPVLSQDSSASSLAESADSYAHDEPAPGSGQPHIARARGVDELEEPRGRVIPLRRVLPIWLIAAAFAAAAVGGGAALGVFHRAPAPEPTVPDQPYTAPVRERDPVLELRAAGTTHRAQARAACDAQRWDECNDLMIKAASEDPAGDQTPEAKTLWSRILQAQIEEAKKRPPDDDKKKKAPGAP